MTADPVESIARAVLYEGYLLYPYTRRSAKNQVRWTFGGVHPPAWGADPSVMQTECLLLPGPGCRLRVQARCLQLVERTAGDEPTWQEAVERTVADSKWRAADLVLRPVSIPIDLPAGRETADGVDRAWQAITGVVTIRATALEGGALKLTVRIENTTAIDAGLQRAQAVLRALISTHVILRVSDGTFVSQTDPPPGLREAADGCANVGTWPVLVGEPGSTDVLLSSPIILEDYPRIAEESPGDLFDGTEIDELLTLRILTLTDEEKAELRATDDRGRELLDRTESLTTDQLLRLHGTLRGLRPVTEEL